MRRHAIAFLRGAGRLVDVTGTATGRAYPSLAADDLIQQVIDDLGDALGNPTISVDLTEGRRPGARALRADFGPATRRGRGR
jgi:hypothetical protein